MEKIGIMLNQWCHDKQLLFVTVVLPRKGRKSFYGRILSHDTELETILFYIDDKASTELISLHDIDNIEPSKNRIL